MPVCCSAGWLLSKPGRRDEKHDQGRDRDVRAHLFFPWILVLHQLKRWALIINTVLHH